ncbi:hypothetical protein B9479_003435 [Cryptococcus floricola]|uniref:NADP-dependent oxidoreductase domain-containing protein n=1 Tax=Cryptococcus floricola TaxID=2591691 RepID=A0A5D3AYH6_9TREE|nr:hypothetical protein B9479_003435 [Cryptococcus floricola]
MVKTAPFQDVQVPVPGFGAMGLSIAYGPADDTESHKTLQKAIDLGCTFWDSAVVYGAGHNESLIGDFFKKTGTRDKVFIASKCGFDCLDGQDPMTSMSNVTNKPEHIRAYIEGTKDRLGSYPDLYYLHRIDPNTPIEESVTTLDELRKAGKTKYIGLSECGVETLRKACSVAKIDALQIEYSPWETTYEENGLIAAAKELGVAVIAYSPLGRGILSGSQSLDDLDETDFRRMLPRWSPENFPNNIRIVDEFRALAEKKGTTPSQLALAWLIAQGTIPIPGTRSGTRLEENFKGGDVDLSEEELKELRALIEKAKPVGERYMDGALQQLGH